MRRIIAAMQTSLDGFIEGPNGELDWVQSWEDPFDLLDKIDACIVGATTYEGYEQYWGAILEDPRATLPFSGRPPTAGEIAYAHFAGTTPHYVLSTAMSRADWDVTRIVRNVDEIRRLKELPGKDMHALGGAALVSSLLDAGLVDELRLVIVPVVLGRGKSLFTGVTQPRAIRFVRSEPLASGVVRLTYDCTS